MRVRSHAQMTTDLPNDLIQDGPDDLLHLDDRVAVDAIAELLRGLGAETSEPTDNGYGWELELRYRSRKPYCIVQGASSCLHVAVYDRWAGVLGDHPHYIELLVLLNVELQRHPRFHDIRWYARGDINDRRPTTASPVD